MVNAIARDEKFGKKIGFDLDGVIVDHTKAKISFLKDHGFVLSEKEVQGGIIEKLIPEEVGHAMKQFLYDDSHGSLLSPLTYGAEEVLHEVHESHVPYFLISRRKNPEAAIKLLKARGIWPMYFNESNTFFVLSKEDKNMKAKELEISHYIDDEPSVLDKLIDIEHRFLFDPRGAFTLLQEYRRIESWPEFTKVVLV